jgi:hypothetical protein
MVLRRCTSLTRARIAANAGALDARRDFIIANTDPQAALAIGGGSANE